MRARWIAALCAAVVACSDGDDPLADGGVPDRDGGGGGVDAAPADAAAAPDGVRFTWIGVSTWLVQFDDTAVLLDAYLSREPFGELGHNAGGAALLVSVLEDAGVESLDAVLVGHGHFDHSFDVGYAGAPVFGSATTCFLAEAQGLDTSRCTVVGGGDEFTVGSLRVRAIRLSHSFPNSLGAYDELAAPPDPPLSETSVPVGATLAFHIETVGEPAVSWLFYDSFAGLDADDGSGEDFLANLNAAYGGGASADLWMASVLPGFAGNLATEQQVQQYLDIVGASTILAQHWDDLSADPRDGVAEPFVAPDGWADGAAGRGVPLVAADDYFGRFALTAGGLVPLH